MDMYTSSLSPALDIGTGCYLLFLSKYKKKEEEVEEENKRNARNSAQKLCIHAWLGY